MNDKEGDDLGLIDYVVIEFAGSELDGRVLPALTELIARGFVRVIDLAFVAKAADGSVAIAELEELSDEDASRLRSVSMFLADVLSEEDLLAAGEELAPNTSAAVIVWENSWAAPFATALRARGGEIVASGRLATIDLLDALTETTPEQEEE